MLKPAAQQIPPSTMSTNRIEVTQNVAISLTNGPRDANPYLPMVKAMAPNAPIGAKRIRMFTTRNTTCVSDSSSATIGFARGPADDKANPNRIETNTTCKMSPLANASVTVVGMMCIRKSATLCALACPA